MRDVWVVEDDGTTIDETGLSRTTDEEQSNCAQWYRTKLLRN